MTVLARTAVVTGGTAGIGLQTAVGLAAQGWHVTVIGRDRARGDAAAARIDAAAGRPAARFVAADLSSVSATRALGSRLAAEGPVHLLVNNVGGIWTDRRESPEGIEASVALNHLSPYVLTEALLDALIAGAPSRIVNITSSVMVAAQPVFDDVEAPGPYYGMAATGRAKLAHLVHTLELAEHLRDRGVAVFAADPGPAATDNAAQMTIDVLPPAARPHWEQIRQGLSTPVAVAARAPLTAATDTGLDARTGLVIGPAGTPDDTLLALVTPEVRAAVPVWTRKILAAL
ncbi:SDR family NAD(P)-dependent oxidoreductase [Catenuloplanes atrovinosus]|uniref:NAD(P)-dependent dehydrogenase (Short-subunit alcohol dehydrogenase family) n=1 Tax=Catenuloplanes atrovinosus TaxID=137266 RepID=A0AAE3YPV8_9ACTN|nr:SDR family NAD(P)-dependent oxidoreductase [Catenuloplanes atrovinosus]MDR7275616.1 NAD(P)-dependent dehydrogenase (short-subunit alcohol dehydrogenase family) [Catenuloplanes atrovinosus]